MINLYNLASKPATTTKPSDVQSTTTSEKTGEDASKSLNADDNLDEEIADDLSEISDEADDILGQQEVKYWLLLLKLLCNKKKSSQYNLLYF